MIGTLIEMCTGPADLVLDFFAGSGTTGHAVWAANRRDEGVRRLILVQFPEPLDNDSGLRTIADLTAERLRRAAKKVREERPDYEGDLGFRVFKLDSSNIRAWEPDRADLEGTLVDAVEHLKADRSEADVLHELLLKLGLDLSVPIEKKEVRSQESEGKAHTLRSVGGGVLMVCLSDKIAREHVEPLAQGIVEWHREMAPAGETTCIFRDSAFADDVAKLNLAAILNEHGLANVRSL